MANETDQIQHIQLSERESKSFIEIPPTQRTGKWNIEVPDFNRTERDTFVGTIKKVIPEALIECDPRLRRRNFTVLFENTLAINRRNPKEADYFAGGITRQVKDDLQVIVLANDNLNVAFQKYPYVGKHIIAEGIVLHELFELDYEYKSEYLKDKPQKLRLSKPKDTRKYEEAEHETIPSNRAVALLKKVLGGNYIVTDTNRIITSYLLQNMGEETNS